MIYISADQDYVLTVDLILDDPILGPSVNVQLWMDARLSTANTGTFAEFGGITMRRVTGALVSVEADSAPSVALARAALSQVGQSQLLPERSWNALS